MDKSQQTDPITKRRSIAQTNNLDELAIQLTNATATGTNLHDLNEDCLHLIFSNKLLHPMDLCSLAETCKKFLPISKKIAPKVIRSKTNYVGKFDVEYGDCCQRTRKDIQRIFRNFGSNLSSVEFECRYGSEDNFLLHLMTEHCNDEKLERLTLHYVEVPDVMIIKLEPIFEGLQKLDLKEVKIVDDVTLFAKLVSLVELSIASVGNCAFILGNIFPKMERFEYKKEKIVMADSITNPQEQTLDTFSTFILRHKTLKRLLLEVCYCDDSCRTAILQIIGKNCIELEVLHLRAGRNVDATYLHPLQMLKSLQTLQMCKFSFADFQFFSALTELRELTLNDCHLPEDSDQFPCLTNLRKINFQCCSSISLVGAISRLENLEVLEFTDTLHEGTFLEIVSVVSGRPNVLTLKCFYRFNWRKYGDNQNVTVVRI